MSSYLRSCILAVMALSSLVACDDSSDTDPTELRSGEPTCNSTSVSLRELDDPHDLVFIDDLEVNVLVDPATAPMDIDTGAVEGQATVVVEGPFGYPLKLKLKITVLPAGPTAD